MEQNKQQSNVKSFTFETNSSNIENIITKMDKGLAIDCSGEALSIAVCNGEKYFTGSLNTGHQHSEKLIDFIDYALKQIEIEPLDLEFCVCPKGPGSFTGLRLGFSSLKALSMAANCPLYAFETLDIWANQFKFWPGLVISTIDAKKKQFYCKIYRKGEAITKTIDISPEKIVSFIDPEEQVLITGPDSKLLEEKLQELLPQTDIRNACESLTSCVPQILLQMSKEAILKKEKPLSDAEGPIYIRKSEAEEMLFASGKKSLAEGLPITPEAYIG